MALVTKLLLVDDDPDDYMLAEAHLKKVTVTTYEIVWATSYQAAKKAMTEHTFDAILLDNRLGEHTGLQLLEELAPVTEAPIILFTGQADRETDMLAMKAGAADFIAKAQLSGPVLERTIRYAIERKRSEQRLNRMALYDALTGLANRALLRDRLEQEVSRAQRGGTILGVLFIDLDGFKRVNDTLGHEVGDELLRQVGSRVSSCARRMDTVSRLGVDEFVFVLPELESPASADVVAQRVLSTINKPFYVSGYTLHQTASIGIALFPDDAELPDEVLKCADVAMYAAKNTEKNAYVHYRPEMSVLAANQLDWENRLRRAVERQEFMLYYQPIVDLKTGQVKRLEALLRWQNGNEVVAAAAFLPMLEAARLLDRVGEWVFQDVCRQHREWREAGLAPPPIMVNVAASQLKRPELPTRILSFVIANQVPEGALGIELTESSVGVELSTALKLIDSFRQIGFTVCFDDFGVGFSCLANLAQLALACLKLDRTFVAGAVKTERSAAIARAIVGLGHSLECEVVAEGVETEAELACVRGLGCDSVQGYAVARPVPASEVFAVIARLNGTTA